MSNYEVPQFKLFMPSTLDEAVRLLTQYGGQAKVVAGATNVLYLMKNGVTYHTPKYWVDITNLPLDYIKYSPSDGLRIGALTKISTIAEDPNVNQYYPALAQAASRVASPQIRRQATAAGDILQEVWCWYLRYNYDCWRNGGQVCYGAYGDNRYYHSIFGGHLCYAVHPGDTTTAYFAFDAEVTIYGPNGQYTMPITQFMPGVTIVDGRVKENVLRYNEILTEIHLPPLPSGTKSAFYKVSFRRSFDFALASAAVRLTFSGNTIESAKIVLGGVANVPRIASSASSYLVGKTLTPDVINEAASLSTEGAQPLTTGTGNAFRVYLAQGAVKKALSSLAQQ